jgi:hypothetical protein
MAAEASRCGVLAALGTYLNRVFVGLFKLELPVVKQQAHCAGILQQGRQQ